MSPDSQLAELLSKETVEAASALMEELEGGRLRCLACGHRCRLSKSRAGVCRVRFLQNGELRVPYGYVHALALDPIEKKPFYHVLPGETALSFGMLGCDLHCGYCQNWISSQTLRDENAVASFQECTPRQIVDAARGAHSRVVISTYNEPLITAEWAAAVFDEAKEEGMLTGFVSNGNATPQVLDYLRPRLDLYKVDLKSFRDANYRELGGTLKAVLNTLENLKARGFWVEVVTLLVPQFNDSENEIREMARFLAELDRDLPWHLTAFHPDYRMNDRASTSLELLDRAYQLARTEGLRYVYLGNLGSTRDDRESTFCPSCGSTLISRRGFSVLKNSLGTAGGNESSCSGCGQAIPGVWNWPAIEGSQAGGFALH
ncbi:MAG TPA: AmmeMemoRadiSam system radical SAM enzyme [Candidatus Krumholzibacteria bacterium]|nr:AmmeMemoRadiSam system radical SAM enzyme [Candidatus Krumholzibacteria bacterium]